MLLLSEYGITPVDTPVHLNRLFRAQGWLAIKEELGLELLDCGASRVFAVADHQVAHIYLNDSALESRVRDLVAQQPGVAQVLSGQEKAEAGLNHPRAGDLVAFAREQAWFTYYYWDDDRRAPDFARCVDIHRKPGYDPVELFLDGAEQGEFPVVSATSDSVRLNVTITVAQMVDQGNFGFRVRAINEIVDAEFVRFHAHDSEDTTRRPHLKIWFTPGDTGASP